MNTAKYERLKKIELDVTKKLFNYIYDNVDLNKVIEELDKDYSYFYDTENNIAFNIWLSLDYIYKDGKTFTEIFLEDYSNSLSKKERAILEERKDSYVSLFEIIRYDKEYVKVKDALTGREFSLLEPDLPNIIKEGEYVFSRVGKSLDNYTFIGDINYLPPFSNYDFVKKVLRDFNLTRKNHLHLSMINYLKRYTLSLYRIYDEIILNLIDEDDDLSFYGVEPLDEFCEFENYLSLKTDESEVISHITNLSNIVDSYLLENDKTIEDLPYINLKKFFIKSIEDGFIGVKKEFLSYVKTLKLYYHFLSKRDNTLLQNYEEIISIRQNPFEYIQILNFYEKNFIIDKNLSYYVSDILNSNALRLVRDFDIFLIYIEGNSIDLTPKKALIRKKDLLEINDQLEDSLDIIPKSPSQKDFVNINFFHHLALSLEILTLHEGRLYFNNKTMDFLLLEDEEKFILMFEFLFSEDFSLNVLNHKSNLYKNKKLYLLDVLSSMKPSTKYSNKYFMEEDTNYFSYYGKYYKLLGLIIYNTYEQVSIRITSLGKKLSKYILNNKDIGLTSNIINLEDLSIQDRRG